MHEITFTPDEIKTIQLKASKHEVSSNLKFLRQHKGLKPGKMHLVLGTPGGGKSTLRNTLLIDFLINNPNKNVCLHLSEESIDDFKFDLITNTRLMAFVERIKISSEQDSPIEDPDFEFNQLIENVVKENCGLFIFDNITTSDLYGETPREQGFAAKSFKQALEHIKCPMILLAHTDASVKYSNKRMIDQNEIRGSKKIVNLAEFLYILQTFVVNESQYTILRIAKHRAAAAESKIFRLYFNQDTRVYDKDIKITTETYLQFFKAEKAKNNS